MNEGLKRLWSLKQVIYDNPKSTALWVVSQNMTHDDH